MPTITVLITTFNGSRFLPETLASVRAQTLRPDEVIVVDDGSTDDSIGIVQQEYPSARVLGQENRGTQAARNVGLDAATCDFIALLDQDDLWEPTKLEKQLAALLAAEGGLIPPCEGGVQGGPKDTSKDSHPLPTPPPQAGEGTRRSDSVLLPPWQGGLQRGQLEDMGPEVGSLSRLRGRGREGDFPVLCYTDFVEFGSAQRTVRSDLGEDPFLDLLSDNKIACSSVMVDRLVLGEDRFDDRYPFSADWDLWIRLAARAPMVRVAEPLMSYRLHEDNYSRNREAMLRGEADLLRTRVLADDAPWRTYRSATLDAMSTARQRLASVLHELSRYGELSERRALRWEALQLAPSLKNFLRWSRAAVGLP